MTSLNDLEITALRRIAADYPELEAEIGASFRSCLVMKRENTGGGFFTDLTAESRISLPNGLRSPIGQVWIAIKGMRFGICCLVFLTDGYPTLLEGYSVGGDDTSSIDFDSCVFEVRDAPPTGEEGGFAVADPDEHYRKRIDGPR